MSYQLTWRSKQYALGAEAAASASASTSATATVATSASVSAECKVAAQAFTKAATYAGLTSDAVTSTVQKCCQAVKDSKGDAGQRAQMAAECFARAAATAGAAAACIAGGVTAPFAGVCGTVGAFMADRVMGYDSTQLAAGVAGGIVCAAVSGGTAGAGCFYAAAEVVGWVGDTLGPIIEGIFDPGAAARRENARRLADNALYFGSSTKVAEAQIAITDQWSASINRIWDLFEASFSPNYRALAASKVGFNNNYSSIAHTMMIAGVPMTILSQEEMAKHTPESYAACEIYGRKVNGNFGPLIPLCPPLIQQTFYDKAGGDAQTAKQVSDELLATANAFFVTLPMVEAAMAAKIAVVAVAVKQIEALDTAKAATRAQLASRVAYAAGVAEAAADAALKGDAKEGREAVARAKNRYDLALAAYNLMLESFGPRTNSAQAVVVAIACSKDVSCAKAQAAVERAKAASERAITNAATATTKRYLFGGAAMAAIAGGVYYFTRK